VGRLIHGRAHPIVDIIGAEISDFSKYPGVSSVVTHDAATLTGDELRQWKKRLETINSALK
jgi:hypothetical protein